MTGSAHCALLLPATGSRLPATGYRLPARYHRRHVDLDQPFRAGKGGDDDAGRDGIDALQPAADDPVDGLAVAGIDEVDHDFDDVVQFGSGFLEELGDVGHRLLGLRRDVADAYRRGGVEVLAHLTAQIDGVAGDDGLAEIVVEV